MGHHVNLNNWLALRARYRIGKVLLSGRHSIWKLCMRYFLILWLGPLTVLGLWYGLSSNDMHFGMTIFSREIHDKVFTIYGNALGMDPEALPPLILRAIIVDTFLVLGVIAFRRRKVLIPWVKAQYARFSGPALPEADPAPTAE